MLKSLLDKVFAVVLFIPAIAVCVIAGIAIYAEMRVNPLFRQVRIGRNQAPFTLYKLRTMPVGTGDLPSHEVGHQKISRCGMILRKLKIDELPQLICVLRGEMSLVGPRPCLPSQVALISARQRVGAFSVLPGITGLAQVQGADMSDPDRLAIIDGDYVRCQSFWLDLKLLLQTISGRGQGDAAGRRRSAL